MEGYQHGGERKEGKRLSRIFYVVTRSRFNPLSMDTKKLFLTAMEWQIRVRDFTLEMLSILKGDYQVNLSTTRFIDFLHISKLKALAKGILRRGGEPF